LSGVVFTELVASLAHLPGCSSSSLKLASYSDVTCFTVRQLAYSAGLSQLRLSALRGFFWHLNDCSIRAVNPISSLIWNDGYRADSGPTQVL
jgi:hypothetical protein